MLKSSRFASSAGLFSVVASTLVSNVGIAGDSIRKLDNMKAHDCTEGLSSEKAVKEAKKEVEQSKKIGGGKEVVVLTKKFEEKPRAYFFEPIGRFIGGILGTVLSMPVTAEIVKNLSREGTISAKNQASFGEASFLGWSFGPHFVVNGDASFTIFLTSSAFLSLICGKIAGLVGRGLDYLIS